ncbi:MAG: hypothetical protein VB130_10170 [Clostridium sp.]|nr:hypothetical protein [Clostridium sp.]
MKINTPSIEITNNYLSKDMHIKNKSLEDQKRIIQTYVQKVVVYEDKIDIILIMDMYGGHSD